MNYYLQGAYIKFNNLSVEEIKEELKERKLGVKHIKSSRSQYYEILWLKENKAGVIIWCNTKHNVVTVAVIYVSDLTLENLLLFSKFAEKIQEVKIIMQSSGNNTDEFLSFLYEGSTHKNKIIKVKKSRNHTTYKVLDRTTIVIQKRKRNFKMIIKYRTPHLYEDISIFLNSFDYVFHFPVSFDMSDLKYIKDLHNTVKKFLIKSL